MNFFDVVPIQQAPVRPADIQPTDPQPTDPPPPASEEEYGSVVQFSDRKRKTGPDAQADRGWKSEWHLSESGTPLPTFFNAMIAMRNHPKLCTTVRFDEMQCVPMLCGQIPNTPHDPSIPRPVRDSDVLAIQEALQATGLRRVAKSTVQDAVERRAVERPFHPVRDYLAGLTWDGEKRIRGWLSRYLGVEGGDYADTVGELFLIALVARVLKPGCKSDHMLILEGPQGALKSTACRVLAGEWFSDNLPDLSRGDAVRLSMHLRGKWLVEIAEMSSFSAAGSHTLKEFITQTEERYTPKYGRQEVYEPRQCLFIGSTNESHYLRDATGARRFWPVAVGTINLTELSADRDQLMAEARDMLATGAKWWPDREFEAKHIAPEQSARYEDDPWHEVITQWIQREGIRSATINEFLRGAICLEVGKFGTRESRRVGAILRRIGWAQNMKNQHRPYEPVGGAL